ncbi:MAG: efflux RND transporter periplasmic adaptor subunit [Verrucomicrobiales bacterium]|nr:efflux RND transporter periplasmic adaptor subunit [Verrucomicrobiales bacterium]
MKLLIRILLPILILGASAFGAWHFVKNKPAPRKFSPPPQISRVEATKVEATEYQIYLKTRGTVTPRTSTTLYPEVSGRITSISPNFREGGFFEEGEILLSIEKNDYETALIVSQSQVAQAIRSLEEEKTRGQQAMENWRRLGKRGTPSDLVLRKPQLAEAEALLQAAKADVEKAKRNLERTDVRAPYAGRILNQMVDVGQYVSSGTQLGRAFATDYMEVRLPLTNDQLSFVDLPETFRDEAIKVSGPEVSVTARLGRKSSTWKGEIVRVDSAIDENTRQLFVVAQIEDPYRRNKAGEAPLKIGMFVDALVTGRKLQDVVVLPRSTVRVSGEVILIDEESKIRRQTIDPMYKSEKEVVLPADGGGVSPGDVVCLTPLAYPVNGAPVIATIDGVAPTVEKIPGIRMGKGKGGGKKGESKGTGPKGDDRSS